MNFRHEVKHEISFSDLLTLRQRLRAAALPDPHAVGGKYRIRSLYFDSPSDRALREKIDGVNRREKFRIRCYLPPDGGEAPLFLRLEKKSRQNGLGTKHGAPLTEPQARAAAGGDPKWMRDSEDPLIRELYIKMTTERLIPRTIVEYTREPFVFPAGNVRVTLDYDIRSGLSRTDFLNPSCVTVPVSRAIILEVKWDEFLPDVIRSAVSLENRREGAFSKYAACRIFG